MVSESFEPTRKEEKQSNKHNRVTKKKWFTCNWRRNQEAQKQSTYSLKYRLETKKVYKRLRQSMSVLNRLHQSTDSTTKLPKTP